MFTYIHSWNAKKCVVGDSGRKFAGRYRSLNLRLARERRKIFLAIYHFRIKSDKKPSGSKVSAVKHVEYINREGTFAHDELWKQSNKFVGNFLTTVQTPNALDGINELLYKTDDFGSIKNSERGI